MNFCPETDKLFNINTKSRLDQLNIYFSSSEELALNEVPSITSAQTFYV